MSIQLEEIWGEPAVIDGVSIRERTLLGARVHADPHTFIVDPMQYGFLKDKSPEELAERVHSLVSSIRPRLATLKAPEECVVDGGHRSVAAGYAIISGIGTEHREVCARCPTRRYGYVQDDRIAWRAWGDRAWPYPERGDR